jgi:dihydroneopterin aldolase
VDRIADCLVGCTEDSIEDRTEGHIVDRTEDHIEDRIELRGLRVLGRHGVTEHERELDQPFELDLDVALDPAASARASTSDDLDNTVDYGRLAGEVSDVVSGSSFHLLETLADRVARTVLAHEQVSEVTVWVRKLRPPVPVDLGSAGVRVTRRREGGREGGS